MAFVIPAKNESRNIEAVLETIVAQRGVECEVVVVDNGSTDDTVERAIRCGARVVHCDGYVSDCRIAGVAATTSPIIFFVDADQRLDPETSQRCVREFEEPSVCAVVVPERPYEPRTWLERVTSLEREVFEAAGRGLPRVFRRERYLEIGGHPAGVPFGEDYALCCKFAPNEIRIADTVIYHQEVPGFFALLKKYFGYGKRMADTPALPAIFTDRAGTFALRTLRYALRSPLLAAGVIVVKTGKFAALRLGFIAGALERPKCSDASPPSARQWLVFGGIAVAIVVLMNWRMLFTPGILIVGDHVSVPTEYWKHILGTWDNYEHGGTANANLSDSPYFVTLGLLATVLGAGIADKALIASFFVISILAATGLLVGAFRLPMIPSFALGVFYTFNPWTAARLAAGHTQILMACAILPLILLLWRTASARAVLLAALGIAIEMCLNLQVALLALVALIAFGGPRRSIFVSLRDAAICLALAASMSFWWILPLLNTHGGNAGHTGLENVLSYTQRTGVLHTAMLRSYWWPAFSDGLYHYSMPAATLVVYLGMAAILSIELALLLTWRWLSASGKVGVALWAGVSCVLVVAHVFPIAYYELLRLPFATLYRDPDKLVPLSLIGLTIAGGDLLSRLRWKNRVGIPIACAAIACVTLPWWSSGSLRGNVQPQIVRDGSVEAANWLAGQKGADLVLWWPAGPYIRYRWYPAGGQDPMRYWSRNPMLNPYYDPAYDASPETSDFLNSLEANVPTGKLPFLGSVLGTYGIRYVAVRNYASTSFTSFPNWRPFFDDVRDLKRVRSFGDTDVYENVGWRPARDVIGHYDAMLTGDFVTMLSLDPELGPNEMLTGDGDPTRASYEYADIDRQLERGLVTYRYESSSPYEVIFPAGAAPAQSFTDLPVTCTTCDVLLVRTNAVSPHLEVNDAPATPSPLYLDLPAWKPRWRAFAVKNASTISIVTGDRNAYVYDAVMVSRQALDAAMLRSFDEVRHHWPTYLADADGLDMRPKGHATIDSDRLGPIVETDSRKWRADVIGTGLSKLSLIFYWWSGGERQRTIDLACHPALCTGSVDLSKGFQRVSLTSARGATIVGFMLSSGKPPLFDNSRVDAIPTQMDATTKLLVPSSHNVGWGLACVNGGVEPTIGNDWATLYATGRVVVDCAARYRPDSLERIGVIISLVTLSAIALALLILGRLRLRLRDLSREDAVETPAG